MSKRFILLMLGVVVACSSPSEPQITPPQPSFAPAGLSGDPIDHRIYADVDPNINAIWIEWNADSTHNTTGYLLRRALDSVVGADGVLADSAVVIAKLETTDQTIEPLPTSHRDTAAIFPGATYFYQLQAYHRSPSGKLTYSKPTHVDLATSFHYTHPVNPLEPDRQEMTVPLGGVTFHWQDPEDGGTFQVILQRLDDHSFVFSQLVSEFSKEPIIEYPTTAPKLVPHIKYQWRVKRIIPNGGSSSRWTAFSISS